jgi:hypothetical protein
MQLSHQLYLSNSTARIELTGSRALSLEKLFEWDLMLIRLPLKETQHRATPV